MKTDRKLLFNPFNRLAGWKAFGIGIIILAITTIAGYFGNTVFYGLSIKTVPEITFVSAFLLQTLGLAITVGIMYLTALIFAKHVRFQDILGTVTLAKYPLLLFAVLSMFFGQKMAAIDPETILYNQFTSSDYVFFAVFGILAVLILVWEIALLYNAFKVSTNLKKSRCAVSFIASLLISEIITILLVALIY